MIYPIRSAIASRPCGPGPTPAAAVTANRRAKALTVLFFPLTISRMWVVDANFVSGDSSELHHGPRQWHMDKRFTNGLSRCGLDGGAVSR